MSRIQPQNKNVSPRTINALMVGMTHHDPDFLRHIMESDEVDAQKLFDSDGSLNEDLFGDTYVHKALESRNGMDQQDDAQEGRIMNDSAPELESENIWEFTPKR